MGEESADKKGATASKSKRAESLVRLLSEASEPVVPEIVRPEDAEFYKDTIKPNRNCLYT